MKIKVSLGIGFPSAKHKDVLDVEDDATDEEIDEIVQEWSYIGKGNNSKALR